LELIRIAFTSELGKGNLVQICILFMCVLLYVLARCYSLYSVFSNNASIL